MARAVARARVGAPMLFEALAAEALPRLGEFNEQALTNTAWAFATAGRTAWAPSLFEAVAAEAARLLEVRLLQQYRNVTK